MPLAEPTISYKVFIKRSVVEALRRVFNAHIDPILQETKITIEYPNEEAKYPAIIVKFYERDIKNAGVGHSEIIDIKGISFQFAHYFYSGDLEFAIHALSSLDRDLIADSLVQTLGMGKLEEWTKEFFDRIYGAEFSEFPLAEYNHLNLNTDHLSGFGETQVPAPWLPEDVLVYQASYRCGIAGGFYSRPPDVNRAVTTIERVNEYPYIKPLENVPQGTNDPAVWVPPVIEE